MADPSNADWAIPVDHWDLPHEDAEGFLGGYVDELAKAYSDRPRGTLEDKWNEGEDLTDIESGINAYNPRKEHLEELQYRAIHTKSGARFRRSEGVTFFDLGLDAEYERAGDIDDEMALVREQIALAEKALDDRDVDQLLEAIECLMDATYYLVPLPQIAMSDLENWSGILDVRDSRDGSDDEIEKEVIAIVSDLACRLCELIAEHPNALNHVEWRSLEQVIAIALEGIGFRVALTPASKDGGKDVVATCLIAGRRRTYYVEIKHWRSGKRVRARDVYEFLEVNLADATAGGLFLSSSGYNRSVYGHLSEIYRRKIALGERRKIITLCQQFSRRRQGLWEPMQPLPQVLFEGTLNPCRSA